MSKFLIIALVIVATTAKITWPIEKCGTDADLIQFTSILLNAKPAKGSTNEITMVYLHFD